MAKKKKRSEDHQVTPLDGMIDHLGFLIRYTWNLKQEIMKHPSTVVARRFSFDPITGKFDPNQVVFDSDYFESWTNAQYLLRKTIILILECLWMGGDAQALRRYEKNNAADPDQA